MLNVLDLHTYYGDSHVLQGVTMHVDSGRVTAVLGRNGVGKTTLCRSLVGLTPARAGRIVFNDTEITRLPPPKSAGCASAWFRRAVEFSGRLPWRSIWRLRGGRVGPSPACPRNGNTVLAGTFGRCTTCSRACRNGGVIVGMS